MCQILSVSPLEKVFSADKNYAPAEYKSFSMLKGERSSFQVAVRFHPENARAAIFDASFEIVSALKDCCSVYVVEDSPSDLPAYANHDDDIISDQPGLYPDLLIPAEPINGKITISPARWRTFWIELDIPTDAEAGCFDLTFNVKNGDELLGSTNVGVKIINAVLPEQTLRYINWFHCDCISEYYKVPALSEEHWALLEKYIRAAADHGVNALLTPIFTPPLDTEIGGERPTVQLIDVARNNGTYSFGFEKFERYVRLAQKCGMKYFEISHLFTQWGASHAPKIMATVDGEYKRIFGWETDASGEEYTAFFRALAPALIAEINRLGIHDACYFHVSDEPSLDHLEQYGKSAAIAHEMFGEFKFIDALSNVDFYDTGLVQIPIPATNHIEPFLDRDIDERWCYYCCGQFIGTSNRFLAMHSRRNRIIGLQMYKYNMSGFLQWGYNFWFSRQSRGLIDPFRVTDGGMAWPSGDPFVVSPGPDGNPLISLRFKVFYDALEDMRACQLLESLIGRDAVVKLIDEDLEEPLTFSNGPRCDCWLLNKREKINALIEQNL